MLTWIVLLSHTFSLINILFLKVDLFLPQYFRMQNCGFDSYFHSVCSNLFNLLPWFFWPLHFGASSSYNINIWTRNLKAHRWNLSDKVSTSCVCSGPLDSQGPHGHAISTSVMGRAHKASEMASSGTFCPCPVNKLAYLVAAHQPLVSSGHWIGVYTFLI